MDQPRISPAGQVDQGEARVYALEDHGARRPDEQVAVLHVSKVYGATAKTTITVRPLT
jgi:Holliday junction resolvase RusA-like endonuclease